MPLELSQNAQQALLELTSHYNTYASLRRMAGFSLEESLSFLNQNLSPEEKDALKLWDGKGLGHKEFTELLNLGAQLRLNPRAALDRRDAVLIGIFLRHAFEIQAHSGQQERWGILQHELLQVQNQKLQQLVEGKVTSRPETKPSTVSATQFAEATPDRLLFSAQQGQHLNQALDEYIQKPNRSHFKEGSQIGAVRIFLKLHQSIPANPAQVLDLIWILHEGLTSQSPHQAYVDQLRKEYASLCASWGYPVPLEARSQDFQGLKRAASREVHYFSPQKSIDLAEKLLAIPFDQLTLQEQFDRQRALLFLAYHQGKTSSHILLGPYEYHFAQIAFALVEKFENRAPKPTAASILESVHTEKAADEISDDLKKLAFDTNAHPPRLNSGQFYVLKRSLEELERFSSPQHKAHWRHRQAILGNFKNQPANPATLLELLSEVHQQLPKSSPYHSEIHFLWGDYFKLYQQWGYFVPRELTFKPFSIHEKWRPLHIRYLLEEDRLALKQALQAILPQSLNDADRFEIERSILFLNQWSNRAKSQNYQKACNQHFQSVFTLIEQHLDLENPARQKVSALLENFYSKIPAKLKTQDKAQALNAEATTTDSKKALAETSAPMQPRVITREQLKQAYNAWLEAAALVKNQRAEDLMNVISEYLSEKNPGLSLGPLSRPQILQWLREPLRGNPFMKGLAEILSLFPENASERTQKLETLYKDTIARVVEEYLSKPKAKNRKRRR